MLVGSAPLDGGAVIENRCAAGTPEAPISGGLLDAASRTVLALPCRNGDADLWFAEAPAELECAKALCGGCPIQARCLAGALEREEPWGVWGGQIFERGAIVARKKPRGRPSKADLARDQARTEAAGAALDRLGHTA